MNRSLSALALLLFTTTGWTQSAPFLPSDTLPVTTLKVSARMVAISAVVKSKDGEIMPGLSKEDFVLKQDGKEEPIRYFAQGSELPLSIALMVDTSPSQKTFLGDEALASDVFLETMLGRPQDRAALVEFDYQVLTLKPLTGSANELHLALSALRPEAASFGGTLLYDAIYEVASKMLAREQGRKAMVILTDGGDNGSSRTLGQAIEMAQRADVQIYSILYSSWASRNPGGPAQPGTGDPGLWALRQLSESTGGRVFTVSHSMSLRQIFAETGEDLRRQYELGYTPPAETTPNTYHKLELRARDKKLLVQARKGFFAQP